MTEVRSTVIYEDVATELSAQLEAGQLWIESSDLARTTQSEFLREESGKSWFNLTAFARLACQPVAHDASHSAWYFGVRSDQRRQLASLEAPDFTLPDIEGTRHSLSDFRGKKVFLVTWASW